MPEDLLFVFYGHKLLLLLLLLHFGVTHVWLRTTALLHLMLLFAIVLFFEFFKGWKSFSLALEQRVRNMQESLPCESSVGWIT